MVKTKKLHIVNAEKPHVRSVDPVPSAAAHDHLRGDHTKPVVGLSPEVLRRAIKEGWL